jgi:Tfp pilus assembly protein PilF
VAGAPATPAAAAPKPTDQAKLKLALTELAHKHYEAALRITHEMLEDNPGDPQALRWQHMCNARSALARNDAIAAADHYEQALAYGEDNREARLFVQHIRRDKKLNSLPFGRYFTKKK